MLISGQSMFISYIQKHKSLMATEYISISYIKFKRKNNMKDES